jgi:hypothetical protein
VVAVKVAAAMAKAVVAAARAVEDLEAGAARVMAAAGQAEPEIRQAAAAATLSFPA